MNLAGPSRLPQRSGRLDRGARAESTYEEDLLRLLGQLTLTEIEDMQTIFAGMTSDAADLLSDREVAMNDFLEQARVMALVEQDSALARRIASGEDTNIVDQRLVQAQPVAPQPNDNAGTAIQQNGNQHGVQAAIDNPILSESQTWGGWLSSMVGWVLGSQPASEAVPASANMPTARAPVCNRLTGHDCVICQDPIRGTEIRAPCGHYYDIGCITDLFQSATRDESLYPPRCCRQNIPFAQVRSHLSQALITTFREKEAELSTLNRVYCSFPTCSRFLGPLSEGIFASRIFVCPAPGCGRRTCGRCRQQHSGDWTHVCRPDADATQVLELSRTSGWARCPGCSQMIELHLGCFHMTCRCRTEFCYLCRARWKTCRCPQWDERRLLAAAEERVDAQLGAARQRPVPIPPRAPVPPRPPHAQAENARLNRAQVAIPGARPPVPAPVFGPVQRQVPAVPPPVPARPLALPQIPVVQPSRPQSIAAGRAQAASSSTSRTAHLAHAPVMPARPLAPQQTPAVHPQPLAARRAQRASSSTSRIVHPALAPAVTMPARTQTGSIVSASASTSASTPVHFPASAQGRSLQSRLEAERVQTVSGSTSGQARLAQIPAAVPTRTQANRVTTASSSTSVSTPKPFSASRPESSSKSVLDVDAARQRMVREMMERLRVDHDCDHERWHYRNGGGRCQSCGHHLPLYLFRCQGCEMLACNRCRRNRL